MDYDLEILMGLEEFDAIGALHNFIRKADFTAALDDFVANARSYLRMYNPTLIIYTNDIRADFMRELKKVGDLFGKIGIRLKDSELENIEEAVRDGNEKALSDGLVKFRAKMEIMTNRIKSARINTDARSAEAGGKPLIIAVDDSQQMLMALTRLLDDKYRLIALTNGSAALNALKKHKPELFLLDIEMPGMNGYELAGLIRRDARFARTPILFLTGSSSRERVLTAKALGVNDYLLKPVDNDVLLVKIEQYLNEARIS